MTEHEFEHDAITNGELQLFRTFWNTSDDNLFIVLKRHDGEYISEKCNPSLQHTFKMMPSQTDGVPLRTLMDEQTYTKIAARYDECLHKNRPVTYEESHTLDSTTQRYWITTILPVVDEANGSVRILGVSREVTPIREAEARLKKHNDTLEHEVKERTKALTEALDQMEKLSITDKLTGLFNRYKIEDILAHEQIRADRYGSCFGLLMLDIDHFKRINDTYGHIQGDAVLKEFAEILKTYARESDSVGRWGGEEFLVIIPESSKEAIMPFAQRLRKTVEQHHFATVGQLTVSIGATLYTHQTPVQKLIGTIDAALYDSKHQGRNLVTFVE
jgi:diguanylate cyclase (GGDEF)-like protein